MLSSSKAIAAALALLSLSAAATLASAQSGAVVSGLQCSLTVDKSNPRAQFSVLNVSWEAIGKNADGTYPYQYLFWTDFHPRIRAPGVLISPEETNLSRTWRPTGAGTPTKLVTEFALTRTNGGTARFRATADSCGPTR